MHFQGTSAAAAEGSSMPLPAVLQLTRLLEAKLGSAQAIPSRPAALPSADFLYHVAAPVALQAPTLGVIQQLLTLVILQPAL